jgi:hypothetical protein
MHNRMISPKIPRRSHQDKPENARLLHTARRGPLGARRVCTNPVQQSVSSWPPGPSFLDRGSTRERAWLARGARRVPRQGLLP